MTGIIVIAVMGTGVAFLAYYVIKSIVVPQRVETVHKLINQGKLQQAIKLGKTLTNKNPKDIEAHYFLGKAFIADKKEELALAEYKYVNANAIFEQTIILESEFRKEMAALYQRFNHYEDALKEYLLLIKMLPREDEYYFQAGKLFESRQKMEQAMSFYQQALNLNPKHSRAHLAVGTVLYHTRQYAEALREFKIASDIKPDDPAICFYIGKTCKEMKDYPSALSAFEKAAREIDFKQRANIELGGCYIAIGQLDLAIGKFDAAIKSAKSERSSDTLLARYYLADCYEKQNKIDKAVAQWTAISRTTPRQHRRTVP
ncbi:MAG: hypothetical protein Pg6C_09340 [Treponemataceae bacterium]|nr:MAG: hypothetical protein Pg6C_09340 [Treponemataceae bacterium]